MKGLGVPFDIEPQESGGTRVAVCRDPDGNFVTLTSGPKLPGSRIAPAKAPKQGRKATPKPKAKAAKKKKR
jgi:hypothetical protein